MRFLYSTSIILGYYLKSSRLTSDRVTFDTHISGQQQKFHCSLMTPSKGFQALTLFACEALMSLKFAYAFILLIVSIGFLRKLLAAAS